MITVAQCREFARNACKTLGAWSPAAEDLLVGTAIQESALKYTRQLGGGPALGYWQMEPATHDDIWRNYLAFRLPLVTKIEQLLPASGPVLSSQAIRLDALEHNPAYGAAMARLKYLRSPLALPLVGDLAGYAKAWKTIYNTGGGAGTEQEFILHWKLFNSVEDAPASDPNAAALDGTK